MSEARTFEFEGGASAAEAADMLKRIAEGLRSGNLSLSLGGEAVTVFPQGDLNLEIEASEKKEKAKIEISVSWSTRGGGDDDEDDES
jgi:amphi-Trp domain-containing protein